MKDQPMKPLENAVFWMEYAIRHNGAPHFRSAALDLTWYQYHMVDVIGFVVATVMSFVGVLYYAMRKIFRKKATKFEDKKKMN